VVVQLGMVGWREEGSPMSKSYKIRYLFSINGIYDRRQGGGLRGGSKKKNQKGFQSFLQFEKCQPVSHMQPAGIAACTNCFPR
jgi:hypothetical protein